MKWIEVRINTTQEASDAISEMLQTAGAGGVAIEDPFEIKRQVEETGSLDYADESFLSSLGEAVRVRAYFPGHMDPERLEGTIREKIAFIAGFLDVGAGLEGFSLVEEEDWANAWKAYYKPVRISDRIVVKPSWEAYVPSGGDEIVIEMDPGMAFGTGTHETTKMCLQLLDRYVKTGDRVIDVGCGTGILSIAARKLGAGEITAVDVDETAVRVTRENCARNGVDQGITALRGVLSDIGPMQADLMVANIIASVLIDLAPGVGKYLKKGAVLILSGIIRERAGEVRDAYRSNGYNCLEVLESGEWVAMVFSCQSSS